MNKILLIIQREYLTRVRKKSFWIASIVVPFLIAGVYAILIYLVVNSNETKTIQIIDESGLFKDNSYTVQFIGNLPHESGIFEILNTQALEDGIIQAHIRNTQEIPVNQLISHLIQHVELKSFNENIPSFNEIFIKVVGGEANEIL